MKITNQMLINTQQINSRSGINLCFLKVLVTTLFVSFGTDNIYAQVSSLYSFTYTNSVFSPLGNSATVVAGPSTSSNTLFTNLPIGFTFYFNCTPYTSFGVSSNGFIWFGTGSVATIQGSPISSQSGETGSVDGIASVFGASLHPGSTNPSHGTISYHSSGSAPNRTCIIEWLDLTSTSNDNSEINLQIELHETSNQIDLKLDDTPFLISGNSFAQVGLRGNTTSDFINRKVNASNNWCNSATGTRYNDSCEVSGTFSCYYPSSVLYSYLPKSCTLGTQDINGASLSIYPNPANEFLVVNNTFNTGKTTILLTDVTGRALLKRAITESPTESISLKDISAGLYFVTIMRGEIWQGTQKILIVR